jgi:dipeptidyl aminopeptidase/acylaminoacyl peptidase
VAGFAAPSKAQAEKIKTPFIMFHGTTDTTVPPERSKLLDEVLKANKIPCERVVYEGAGHNVGVTKAKEVNGKVEAWFEKYAKKAE